MLDVQYSTVLRSVYCTVLNRRSSVSRQCRQCRHCPWCGTVTLPVTTAMYSVLITVGSIQGTVKVLRYSVTVRKGSY